jgi:hypothetical protein
VLRAYLRRFVLVFFHDILIYGSTWVKHLQHVRLVLLVLWQHKLVVKQSKCSFGETSISYLSHIISDGSVDMDSANVEAIQAWLRPMTVKGLWSFLDLVGYTTVNSSRISVWLPAQSLSR